MTTEPVATEPSVYKHPNIREMTIRTLTERAEERQNRRMLIAIETNQVKQIKLASARDKDLAKFAKAVESVTKKLQQAHELLVKADNDLALARGLHNQITLLDKELG